MAEYNRETREVSGYAQDLNDWARQCVELEAVEAISIDRPGSATVRLTGGAKFYRLTLTNSSR